MAVKLAVVALLSMVLSVYAKFTLFDAETNVKRRMRDWNASSCSKPEDGICPTRPQSWCRFSTVRMQCPRLCGVCAPFNGVCPSSYVFGCCRDGRESLMHDKSDCEVKCRDRNEKICRRLQIKADCDLQANTPLTRKLCPVTCGACHDYGN